MNSEELELSLRTEFESYLKDFLADMRQEVSEFQKNFETEFEKHKSQTDDALRRLVDRFEKNVEFDKAFNESVIEHLRLARDEGATITAVAIGEAEKLKEDAAPAAEFDRLRDAINEISSKTSQSEILRSLVDHASHFAPRGAFFIVKNEQFVGWRAFGSESIVDDAAVRAVQFPMSADTVLAGAVTSLATEAAGSAAHTEDKLFLDALDFGSPDRMYAIPLVARGRGVAVLYADYGTEGVKLQPEALETLVRVAGLTVELAAAGVQPVPAAPPIEKFAPQPVAEPEGQTQTETSFQAVPEVQAETVPERTEQEFTPSYNDEQPFTSQSVEEVTADEQPAAVENFEEYTAADEVEETPAAVEVTAEGPAAFEEYQAEVVEHTFEPVSSDEVFETTKPAEPVFEETQPAEFERFGESASGEALEEVTYFEPAQEKPAADQAFAEPEASYEYVPADPESEEFPEVIEEAEAKPAEFSRQHEPSFEYRNGSPAHASEPVAEVASAQSARTRYRDRNVDLPIEVPEDERRLHNDARRFARLLVSEIKLYNEQKVNDGRSSGDLYDRLREAIDRSRDMYDKRVQQQVAEKFDYFHYELVNSLAEGDDVKLGASYPGSKVPA